MSANLTKISGGLSPPQFNWSLSIAGSSLVYYMPGYYAFKDKPTYHNHPVTASNSTVEAGRNSIDEAIEYLSKDPSLNFMQIWVDQPDDAGHKSGKSSIEVSTLVTYFDVIF